MFLYNRFWVYHDDRSDRCCGGVIYCRLVMTQLTVVGLSCFSEAKCLRDEDVLQTLPVGTTARFYFSDLGPQLTWGTVSLPVHTCGIFKSIIHFEYAMWNVLNLLRLSRFGFSPLVFVCFNTFFLLLISKTYSWTSSKQRHFSKITQVCMITFSTQLVQLSAMHTLCFISSPSKQQACFWYALKMLQHWLS